MLLLHSGMGLCPLPWLHIPTHLLERLNLLMEKLHSPLCQPGKHKFICYWQIKSECSIAGHLLSIRNYRNKIKAQILPKTKELGCSFKYPITYIFIMQKYTPGLTVKVGKLIPHWGNEQEFQTLFPASQGCIPASLSSCAGWKSTPAARGTRSSSTHLLVSQGR